MIDYSKAEIRMEYKIFQELTQTKEEIEKPLLEKIKELENSINNIDGTSNLVLAALLQYITLKSYVTIDDINEYLKDKIGKYISIVNLFDPSEGMGTKILINNK
jgi:hypothetical protein